MQPNNVCRMYDLIFAGVRMRFLSLIIIYRMSGSVRRGGEREGVRRRA